MRKYLHDDFKKTVVNIERVMNNYKELNNSNFKNGTFRIQKEGYYKLTENIIFEPNKEDGFLPTIDQMRGGTNAKYPMAPFGPYILGFFSAITIECGNVVLDLNGFCISLLTEILFLDIILVIDERTPFLSITSSLMYDEKDLFVYDIKERKRALLIALESSFCFFFDTPVILLGIIFPFSVT